MSTSHGQVRIGNFIYYNFPTIEKINGIRREAVEKLIIFFRIIGLGTPKQINAAIGIPENDDRIERLLRQTGFNISVEKDVIEENIRETAEMQKGIIDDGGIHYIDMSEIARRVQKVNYHDPEKAIRELLTEQGCKLLQQRPKEDRSVDKDERTITVKVAARGLDDEDATAAYLAQDKAAPEESTQGHKPDTAEEPKKASEPAVEAKAEPESGSESAEDETGSAAIKEEAKSATSEEKTAPGVESEADKEGTEPVASGEEIKSEVKSEASEEGAEPEVVAENDPWIDKLLRLAKNCTLEVRRDKAVLKNKEYMQKLLQFFPSVSYEIMTVYLFNNTVTTAQVQVAFSKEGVKKPGVGNPRGEKLKEIIYERAAFVAWTGGNWKEFLKETLKTAEEKIAKATTNMLASRRNIAIEPGRGRVTHIRQISHQEKDGQPTDSDHQVAPPKHIQGEPERHDEAGKATTPAASKPTEMTSAPAPAPAAAPAPAVAKTTNEAPSVQPSKGYSATIELYAPDRRKIDELIAKILLDEASHIQVIGFVGNAKE